MSVLSCQINLEAEVFSLQVAVLKTVTTRKVFYEEGESRVLSDGEGRGLKATTLSALLRKPQALVLLRAQQCFDGSVGNPQGQQLNLGGQQQP